MHRVVEIVVPLSVEPVPARLARRDQLRVVEVGLGDQRQRPALVGRQRGHLDRHLLEQVHVGRVAEGVHGVDPQAVDVVVLQPHPDVVEDEPAYLARALAVEVDQVAPGVAARLEVRPELRQVVPRRPEVVVDHVLDHAHAGLVAAVHEPLVAGRSAVRLVDRVPQHAVVAPVVHAAHRVDRHQLDQVDAEGAQVAEPPERRVERPLSGERPDVELVDHRAAQLPTGPGLVVPHVGRGIEGSRALVDARRLTPRPRVGSGRVRVVDQVAVVHLRQLGNRVGGDPPVVVPARHPDGGIAHRQPDPLRTRRPHVVRRSVESSRHEPSFTSSATGRSRSTSSR